MDRCCGETEREDSTINEFYTVIREHQSNPDPQVPYERDDVGPIFNISDVGKTTSMSAS